jgi:serine/threonine protein kinase
MSDKSEPMEPSPNSTAHGAGAGLVGVAGAGTLGGAPVDVDASAEKLPRQFGKYMLLRRLASGGMAELFLALHRSVAGFEKLVVIKRILPQMNGDQQFIDMLLHEARIAATLSHTNIVQTFDVGQLDGSYFIAMEHIHGEDIRTIIRQMRVVGAVEFPLVSALHIVMGLCAGLAYAHEKRDLEGKLLGIVHRDISPQNIVVTFSGDVKVVDFGVAKSIQAHEDPGAQLKGKVPYMSPEQAKGLPIDSRSDVFAAGVVLFELTTGKRLFKGASEQETIALICDVPYPRPSEVVDGYPAELDRIVMKALARNRDERYPTARALQSDLEEFVRRERLPVSSSSMSSWMQSLFADTLAKQNETLQEIKQLADKLAAELPPLDYNASATGVYARFDVSAPGAVASASIPAPPPPRSRVGVLAGLAIGALAVGGAIFAASRSAPPATTASAAATPSSAAVADRASLRVESTPAGAAIWLDGDLRRETTPATLENLPIGRELSLKLTLEGYESHRATHTLGRAGDTETLRAEMKTGSVKVELDVTPEPTVWVDGKPWKGSSKSITGLAADEEHKVMVTATGYLPKTFVFTGKQGETKKFQHALTKMSAEQIAALSKSAAPSTPAAPSMPTAATSAPDEPAKPQATGPGTVRVNAKGGYCNVSINGQPYGPTPVSATVPAGTVRVSCKPDSGPSQTQAVKVDAGQTARVSFSVGG